MTQEQTSATQTPLSANEPTNSEAITNESTHQDPPEQISDHDTEPSSTPPAQLENQPSTYSFKINGETLAYSHNDVQKALAAQQGFEALQTERENFQKTLAQERDAIETDYLNRILLNMPEFLQNYNTPTPPAQTELQNTPPADQPHPTIDLGNQQHLEQTIEQTEDIRNQYHNLLNNLQEQAIAFETEETQKFFSNLFEQQQETNPTIKNIFFELLSRLQEDGHTHGDYNEVLKAARNHHNELTAQTLQQASPESLVTILGEQNLKKLNDFLSNKHSQNPNPTTSPTLIQPYHPEVVPNIIL